MKDPNLKDPYHLSGSRGKSHLKKDVRKEHDIVKIPIKGNESEHHEAGGDEKDATAEERGREVAGKATPGNDAEPAPAEVKGEAPEQKTVKGEERDRELQDLQERIKRLHADFENFRKRKEEEAQEAKKFASEEIIRHLLSIMDNFERALSSSEESRNFQSLLEGLQMVHRQMKDLFEREGVKEIEALHAPFDPALHQAVMKEDNDTLPDETVVQELQKEYRLKDKVIRPSMVKVSRRTS